MQSAWVEQCMEYVGMGYGVVSGYGVWGSVVMGYGVVSGYGVWGRVWVRGMG